MNSLTHENFWKKMNEENPHIIKLFLEWIDGYKERIGWRKIIPKAKFHELPIEMQLGILDRFKQEISNGKELAESQCKITVRKLEQWFYAIDLQIKNKKS